MLTFLLTLPQSGFLLFFVNVNIYLLCPVLEKWFFKAKGFKTKYKKNTNLGVFLILFRSKLFFQSDLLYKNTGVTTGR